MAREFMHRYAFIQRYVWLAGLFVLLCSGCASLQIDVDVYKGPLVNERHIQVRQYASMAASAKPLIRDLVCRQRTKKEPNYTCNDVAVKTSCATPASYRERFLCEVLDSYVSKADDGASDGATKRRSERPTSSDPDKGLDELTQAVTVAMAAPAAAGDYDKRVGNAVDKLNEALILFAQKLLYMTNNELLFPEDDNATEHDQRRDKALDILQSLGNTILVHANDLRRRTEKDELHAARADSVSDAVQQAFQPEASATVDGIITRLGRFNIVLDDNDKNKIPDTSTPQQKVATTQLQDEIESYLAGIAPLLAAYRSVVGELPAPLAETPINAADAKDAVADRQTVKALHSGQAGSAAGGLGPLMKWIDDELGKSNTPARLVRLEDFRRYLGRETPSGKPAATQDATRLNAAFGVLQTHLAGKVTEAKIQAGRLIDRRTTLQATIAAQNDREADLARLARAAGAKDPGDVRTKTTDVVDAARAAVLAEAKELRTRDPVTIMNILLRHLEAKKTNGKDKPGDADIDLTRAIVRKFTEPQAPCYASSMSAICRGSSTIEVVDNLIANLRAQRVHAIAAGDEDAANNLLKAINAAYEQRTAMIYLRPASDYLRSVYSSTSLQDGTEDQYRNMLREWMQYLPSPGKNDGNSGRAHLEKINWQNINKVTVSGGGFTNYVLAKDDVGNWYVKAYGSDPEAIIKSATSLALFNSGKAVNVNLLRRLDVQRQLDEDQSLTATQRIDLRKELGTPDPQGGEALIKVRDRYARRYAKVTYEQAGTLLATLQEIPVKARERVAEVKEWPEKTPAAAPAGDAAAADAAAPAGAATDKAAATETTCTIAAAKTQLDTLEGKHLAAARDQLAGTVADAAKPEKANAALLEKAERHIQAALTAMHLYRSDVPRTLKQGKGGACDTAERNAAELVRGDVRGKIVAVAMARRADIERYDDALTGILDIVNEK